MKIVGVANDKTFICEIDISELDMLCGTGVGWGRIDMNQIGKEFNIRKAWGIIRDMHAMRDELPRTAGKLRALADLLEPIAVEIPDEESAS